MLGNNSSPTGVIHLENVSIPSTSTIGAVGAGNRISYDMINFDRLLYAVFSTGASKKLIHDAMKYANERRSFNKPIGDNQYVQDMIVSMKVQHELIKSISHTAFTHLNSGSQETASLCSIAKLHSTEAMCKITQDFVQLHGHYGYSTPFLFEHVGDALGLKLAGGTSEIQKMNIYNQLLKEMSA